jgi:adenine/guanine phosphoribosyltransferase-like PRPP-binding protein
MNIRSDKSYAKSLIQVRPIFLTLKAGELNTYKSDNIAEIIPPQGNTRVISGVEAKKDCDAG